MDYTKFRAWNKANDAMLSVFVIDWREGYIVHEDLSDNAPSYDRMEPEEPDCVSNLDDVILMQYTGFKDDTLWAELTEEERRQFVWQGNMPSAWSGKEVYDRDILECDHHYIGIICWQKEEFCWVLKCPEKDFHLNELQKLTLRMKITGNTLENPDRYKRILNKL
jgi:uncharacterized phage protein (TIGR01671 family)